MLMLSKAIKITFTRSYSNIMLFIYNDETMTNRVGHKRRVRHLRRAARIKEAHPSDVTQLKCNELRSLFYQLTR